MQRHTPSRRHALFTRRVWRLFPLFLFLVAGCDASVLYKDLETDSEESELRSQQITLKTFLRGSYVVAERGGGAGVRADQAQVQNWEKFTLQDLNGGALSDGDRIYLVAHNGQYVAAEDGGGGAIHANRSTAREWETFKIIRVDGPGPIQTGDRVALQTQARRKYFCAENGGGGRLEATSDTLQSWETFILERVDLPPTQPQPVPRGEVETWITTGDQQQLLQEQPRIALGGLTPSNTQIIEVDASQQFQEIDGFGAAMTGSSAWLMSQRLSSAQRSELFTKLFDPAAGAGLAYLRLPMGSSDFSLSSYTYDDMPAGQQDSTLSRFSIDNDRQDIIPMLQLALKTHKNVKIMGSPWSAPAWMKDTQKLNGGSLKPTSLAPYARYFTQFVQAYREAGLPIAAVTLQNEPHHTTGSYPSMRMEPPQAVEFVANHLGPAFAAAGVKTKILVWDHNWNEPDYPTEVLNSQAARKYIAGSAFHCYAGDVSAQSQTRDAHPDKEVHFTECSGGEWAPGFRGNLVWGIKNLIIGATRNWARSVMQWNLALNEQAGPTNGGCTNCRGVVTIRERDGAVTYNVEYYVLAHAGKFVAPGAHRIGSNRFNGLETVAFQNPNGSKVLLVLNSQATRQSFRVRTEGQQFESSLPAFSVATFRWP